MNFVTNAKKDRLIADLFILRGQVSKLAMLVKNFFPGLAVHRFWKRLTALRLTEREKHPQGCFSFSFCAQEKI